MAALSGYVRKTGSDNNGGSSNTTGADKTAADLVTNGTTTVTSATITFAAGDVDKLLNIVTKGRYRITAFGSSTSVTVSGSPTAGSGLTGNIGGAVVTVGALMANANAALASGDTVYIGAGTYREVNTVTVSGITWTGDVDGVKTGDPGRVVWSAYTTNDKTAASATSLLNFNGFDNLTFQNIEMVGGANTTATHILATTTTSTGCTFTDCAFSGYTTASFNSCISVTSAAATALNWAFNRCHWAPNIYNPVLISLGGTTDYNANVTFTNCSLGSGGGIGVSVSGAGAVGNGAGGGVTFYGCTTNGQMVSTASTSKMYPVRVFCCAGLAAANNLVSASVAGEAIADFNVESVSSASLAVGSANSQVNGAYLPAFHYGQERIWGGRTRPFCEPTDASPLLGFAVGDGAAGIPATATGTDATVGTLDWTAPTNVFSINATHATAALALNVVTHYEKVTNFGFAVPSDATIKGVIVQAWAKSSAAASIQDQNVKLVKGGVIGGNDKATASTKLGTAVAIQSWGASNDLWGNTFTPTDINASTFGVALAYKNINAASRTVSLDFVNIIVYWTSASGALTTDIRSAPRPSGGLSPLISAGAYGRGNIATKTTAVSDAGSVGLLITGPGWHDFDVDVPSGAQNMTVKVRYDSPYDTTVGRPQVQVLRGTECGVADQTVTATAGASGAFETQTLSITPTANGRVTLRVISRDFNGAGLVYIDTFADA